MTDKTLRILEDAQLIIGLSNCIILAQQNDLTDARFKVPTCNQKARRILQDATDIKKHIYTLVKPKESEFYIDVEHAYEMYRLMKWFATMNTPQLREFNNLCSETKTYDINELAKSI